MAFNGSGVFNRLYSWVADRNAGVKILAQRMDQEMDGFATGLSNTITRDGQSTVTADIPMNNRKITGLGDAMAGTDALNRATADARYPRRQAVTDKSANYTAVATDIGTPLRFTAAATLSLTAAATIGNRWHCIVIADGGDVTIDPDGAETINGSATLVVPDGRQTEITCDGSRFFAVTPVLPQARADIASATTTDIGAESTEYLRVTGTVDIEGLGTAPAGVVRDLLFADALTLTHNATSLILLGGQNIPVTAGDVAQFRSEGSGNWRMTGYKRNAPLVGTVSQIGGLPTGSILERGNNSNGSFIKYADGTLICWAQIRLFDIITSQIIGRTWTFPAVFDAVPYITHTPLQGSGADAPSVPLGRRGQAMTASATTTSVSLRNGAVASDTYSSPNFIDTHVIAIGRWF